MDTPENPYAGPPAGHEPPARPAKKGPSGCFIALMVVVGLGVLGMIALGVVVYSVASQPEFKEMFGAVAGMMNAPGREELRAAGCEEALVMDLRPMAQMARRQAQERGGTEGAPTDAELAEIEELDQVFALCIFDAKEPTLDCAAVARAYLGAVPEPPPSVAAVVQRSGQDEPVCAQRYDATGRLLGEAELPEQAKKSLDTPVERPLEP